MLFKPSKMLEKTRSKTMKHLLTSALVLMFGAPGIQARDFHLQMTFSGTGTYLSPPIILVPGGNSPLVDVTTSGNGSLGPFTQHEVSATTATPTGFGCAGPNSALFMFVAGAGAFRFQDGSLLTYKVKAGTSCINFAAGSASDTITLQITGGTGAFKNASGALTVTTTSDHPILFDATGQQPVLVVIPNAVATGTIVLPNED
jgi:hypothetical protein